MSKHDHTHILAPRNVPTFDDSTEFITMAPPTFDEALLAFAHGAARFGGEAPQALIDVLNERDDVDWYDAAAAAIAKANLNAARASSERGDHVHPQSIEFAACSAGVVAWYGGGRSWIAIALTNRARLYAGVWADVTGADREDAASSVLGRIEAAEASIISDRTEGAIIESSAA